MRQKLFKPKTKRKLNFRFGILQDNSNTGILAFILRALMKTFYKGASAAILTYDITQ